MRTVVLVPRRNDNGPRDRLWTFVKARLSGWEVHEGHHPIEEGPFNRSAAINRAAAAAGYWDVAIILDSDTVPVETQMVEAVRLAYNTNRITFAFTDYMALSKQGTRQILDGYDGSWEPFIHERMEGTCSSCVVVSRKLWDLIGGFDEEFRGWGWEDVAFSVACQAVTGGLNRVPGPVWHLWHPPSVDAGNLLSPIWKANRDRFAALYEPAMGDRDAMLRVLHG